MKFEWETIFSDGGHNVTQRARVIGGWLVSEWNGTEDARCMAMCFVPDPAGHWNIDNE